MNRSKSTIVKKCVTGIDGRMKGVFNRDFFSIYEGIIEKVDIDSGLVSVRIPDLDNTLYDDCRMVTLCNTATSAILPIMSIGTHVIIGFQAFSLAKPVVLGQINSISDMPNPFEEDTLVFKNGACSLRIDEENITIANKYTTINITPDKFKITYKNCVFEMTDSGVVVSSPGDVSIGAVDDITFVTKNGKVTSNGNDMSKDDIGWI